MIKNLITFLFLAASVSLFWFWTKPAMEAIDSLRLEKISMEEALADARELQRLKDELLKKYSSVAPDDLSRMSKILPKDSEVTKLLIEVDNVAQASGVVVKNLNAAESSKLSARNTGTASQSSQAGGSGNDYLETKFTISVSASYESFLRFLEELELSLRLIDVVDIKFSSGEKNQYEITINAIAYSQI